MFRKPVVALSLVVSTLAGTGAGTAVWAQTPLPPAATPSVVERTAKGPTARNFQVGVYLNVQPDCTSGTLPALRMVTPPINGTVSIKRGKVSATNYKQCLALEVPGFIAFYQSKADFVGSDEVMIEVKYPAGRTEVQRIKIDVGGSGSGVAPAVPKAPQGQKI
ncbi:hypothetical protein AB8B21_03485 [Tardiphaga sp. 866_E4_N2_1]|jgi:hypothetical protein|uniref:hypothetical protein n=1 Tax=unclassified Tardiphaga TaxID=2631404 RepID=UPI003F244AC5